MALILVDLMTVACVASEQDAVAVRWSLILLVFVVVVIRVPLVGWQEVDRSLDVGWVLWRVVDAVAIASSS